MSHRQRLESWHALVFVAVAALQHDLQTVAVAFQIVWILTCTNGMGQYFNGSKHVQLQLTCNENAKSNATASFPDALSAKSVDLSVRLMFCQRARLLVI